jgi:hypothetical protein
MKRTQFLLLSFVLIWSCIPIVDRIAPTIQDVNNLRLTYHLQDTIKLFLTYRDNDRLDSATIKISRQVPASNNPLEQTIVRKMRGRRFEDTIRIFIPRNTPLGIYNLRVQLQDFAKLQAVPRDTIFELLGDNRPPVFVTQPQVISTGVGNIPERDLMGNFITCRSSVIQLAGTIADNIRLREIRVSLNDGATNLLNTARVVTSDTVRLLGLFDRDIRIPSDIADGKVLRMTITAIDGNNNSVSQNINFIVNCDDQAPAINITRTNPQVNASREVNIIEGNGFSILEGTVTDNKGLGTLVITFNELNQTRRTVVERNLNGARSIKIEELLASIPNSASLFQIPTNATPGSIFELIVAIRDQSGNVATPYRVLITVIRDEVPSIFVTRVSIDNREIILASANLVARGQTVQIDGKIEEDRGLEYIQILWGPEGQESTIVNLKGSNITLPFDFADPRSVNRFVVPDSRTITSMRLIIKAKDLKNPEEIRQFVFQVR